MSLLLLLLLLFLLNKLFLHIFTFSVETRNNTSSLCIIKTPVRKEIFGTFMLCFTVWECAVTPVGTCGKNVCLAMPGRQKDLQGCAFNKVFVWNNRRTIHSRIGRRDKLSKTHILLSKNNCFLITFTELNRIKMVWTSWKFSRDHLDYCFCCMKHRAKHDFHRPQSKYLSRYHHWIGAGALLFLHVGLIASRLYTISTTDENT